MVFCFSFIVNCAKPDAPIKGPKHVFNMHVIGTYKNVEMRMRSGFLLSGWTKPHLFTSISYHKKSLSTLNIYTMVIRLKSQVLRKEDSRLVADRQTDRHANRFISLMLKAFGPLDRHAYHLSYQGSPKSPPQIFFVLTNLDCFDLGTSLKKLYFKPRQWRSLYRSLAKGNKPFW